MTVDAILEIRELTRRFGGVTAVDHVSFSVPRGSITALIGPNGAGKTTLFNLIAGFDRPSAGDVLYEGGRITGARPDQVAAKGILRTFQLVRPFAGLTVRENLLVGGHRHTRGGVLAAALRPAWVRAQEQSLESEMDELLDLTGLAGLTDRTAGTLTYGQQRLLEVARAVAARPRILLLDEPAAGLNAAETRRLSEILRTLLSRGITIFFVEHDMEMVMSIAQHVIVLNLGKRLAEGSPESIREDPRVIEAYLGG